MPVTTPMKLMTLKIPPEEKARLQKLAAERNVSLSWALREGAKLILEDARSEDHVAAA